MSGVNKVTLVGRLGQDPELRYTTSGQGVTRFTLATSDTWKDKNTGEKKEKTEWHRVTVWGKLAELCNDYLKKGRQVYLDGKLQTRSWEDTNGVKKYTTEIVANNVVFLGSTNESTNTNNSSNFAKQDAPVEFIDGNNDIPDADTDDIPF